MAMHRLPSSTLPSPILAVFAALRILTIVRECSEVTGESASKIQVATTNAGARAQGGLTPDFLALSIIYVEMKNEKARRSVARLALHSVSDSEVSFPERSPKAASFSRRVSRVIPSQ